MNSAICLGDIDIAAVRNLLGNRCFTKAVCAIGGTVQKARTTATAGVTNENMLPEIPSNQAPIGAVKIATDSTHTFTPGTTGLNATGITDTYFDLSCVPTAGYPA